MPETIFDTTPPAGQFYCDECDELEDIQHAVEVDEGYHFCRESAARVLCKCDECQKYHLKRSIKEIQTGTRACPELKNFCPDCVQTMMFRCAGCHIDKLKSTGTPVAVDHGEIFFCTSCLSEHTFACPYCSEVREKRNRVNIRPLGQELAIQVCGPCGNRHFTLCQHCNHGYTDTDPRLQYREQYMSNICDACVPVVEAASAATRRGGSGVFQNYSTRINVGKFGQPKDKVFFGVELEVECDQNYATEVQNDLGKFVILKPDGSVPHGFEIVSAPATLDAHKEKWNPFFKKIKHYTAVKKANMRSWHTTTCGMHVHISRRERKLNAAGRWDGRTFTPILSELQIAKMQQFIHTEANWEFIKKIAGRDPNQYCKWDYKKNFVDGINGREGSHQGHRTALNLSNVETVELRIFKGTLKPESFFKNIEFAKALVEFTKPTVTSLADFREPKEGGQEVASYKKFLEWMALPEHRQQYPNLVAFIVRKGKNVDQRYGHFFSDKREKEHALRQREKTEVYDNILPAEELPAVEKPAKKKAPPSIDIDYRTMIARNAFRTTF